MLNDSLNIRDSLQTITKQLREKCPMEEAPKNILALLTQLFSGCIFEKAEKNTTAIMFSDSSGTSKLWQRKFHSFGNDYSSCFG